MGKLDDFADAVLTGAKDLAKNILEGFENQAGEDAKAFLDKMKNDLQRWAKLRTERKITDQDFIDLVQAKKALAEIHALTQAGIATIKLERFRTEFIKLVVDKALAIL